MSGVLAVVAAGLCAGFLERRHLRADTRLHASALWGTLTLLLNGAVFVMLGLQMRQVLHRVDGYDSKYLQVLVLLLTFTLFAVRLVWTLVLDWRTRHPRQGSAEKPPGLAMLLVPVLCGVRGSLALSATLSIPLFTATGDAMPGRNLAVFLAASTIAMTLLVSGLLLPFLEVGASVDTTPLPTTMQNARVAIARAATRVIDAIPLETVSLQLREWAMTMRHLNESRIAASQTSEDTSKPHRGELTAQRELSMRILAAQRQELRRLQKEDGVAQAIVQEFEVEFDLAEIALDRLEWKDQQRA